MKWSNHMTTASTPRLPADPRNATVTADRHDAWLIDFVGTDGRRKTQTLASGRLSLAPQWAMVLDAAGVMAAVPASRVLEVRRAGFVTAATCAHDDWLLECADASGEGMVQALASGRLSLASGWAMVLDAAGVVAAVPAWRVLEVRRLSRGGDAWRAA